MATYTDRLKLRRPVDADFVNVDNDVNLAWDRIDDVINAKAVASALFLPSTPYQGQIVYQEDTRELKIFQGSAWITWASDKFPRGYVGGSSLSSNSANIAAGATAGPFLSFTFTPEANRYYWIEHELFLRKVSGTNQRNTWANVLLRWELGAVVTVGGTAVGTGYNLYSAHDETDNTVNGTMINEFTHAGGAQLTVGLFLTNGTSDRVCQIAGDADRVNRLYVRDVGAVA